MPGPLDRVLERLDATSDEAVDRLKTLLRIPSISTDPAYRDRVREAATWLADDLGTIGFDASVRDTNGQPMVVAHHPGPGPGAPRVLYYGHYDVQPPDPLELWESDPFEPVIADGRHGPRIVARGAVDDKGQLMTFVEAFRAWHGATGTLPAQVTVLLEGEEESGSVGLEPFLEANRDELAADVCVVCDTAMWDIETPAITYALRGLVYVEVTLSGPSHDLHSGLYGGTVVNPNNALARIIAGLHDENGAVQVPGFYDDVLPVGDTERRQWQQLGFDDAAFLRSAGLAHDHGEHGYSVLERIWARPTCDVNGIVGGYTGEGAKTVIPSDASCKVSFRLVADQSPDKVLDGIRAYLDAHTPPGCRWELKEHGLSPAIRVPTDSPYLKAAMRGLASVYAKAPVLIGSGGSIPAVGAVRRLLGMDSLLVGFGLEDDRMHSPNEKFELACFRNGARSHAAILAHLAGVGAGRS